MKSGDIRVFNGQIGKVVGKEATGYKFLPMGYGRYSESDLKTIDSVITSPASHEEKIKLLSTEFVWGNVIKWHCIGDFQIVEYKDKREQEIRFHSYLNYRDTNTSHMSLDAAIIDAIGRKYEGANGRASDYFCKLLNI